MGDVKAIFDGYDVGVRCADDAVGVILDRLDSLGVLDETAVLLSSDHGEQFGELGVYADHQGADQATTHIPAILRWPGLEPRVQVGLHYHLDMAATVVDLAGATVPADVWDGESVADRLRAGEPSGRDHLVLTQGAWTCQRGVRFGDHLYLRTWHDGYHCWNDEMLFDVAADPQETVDLASSSGSVGELDAARAILEEWTAAQLERSGQDDPMETVLAEGGPYHTRAHLPAYLDRLRETGRGHWADDLVARFPDEADPERWRSFRRSTRKLVQDLIGG